MVATRRWTKTDIQDLWEIGEALGNQTRAWTLPFEIPFENPLARFRQVIKFYYRCSDSGLNI